MLKVQHTLFQSVVPAPTHLPSIRQTDVSQDEEYASVPELIQTPRDAATMVTVPAKQVTSLCALVLAATYMTSTPQTGVMQDEDLDASSPELIQTPSGAATAASSVNALVPASTRLQPTPQHGVMQDEVDASLPELDR